MAQTTGILDGGMVTLFVKDGENYTPFGYSTSCSIELSVNEKEVSYKGSGGWSTASAGKKSWTANIDGLAAYDDSDNGFVYSMDTAMKGDPVTIYYVAAADENHSTANVGDIAYKGDAIITNVSSSASDEEKATYSVSLKGASALTKETIA